MGLFLEVDADALYLETLRSVYYAALCHIDWRGGCCCGVAVSRQSAKLLKTGIWFAGAKSGFAKP